MMNNLLKCRSKYGCEQHQTNWNQSQYLLLFEHTWEAALPCQSGCVSGGWRDRRVMYDDLHLGTTGREEDIAIFNK